MTPTEAITALEKALEAYESVETDLQGIQAFWALIAAASPVSLRTLLDAHAGALRDAERYAAIRSLGWTVNIDHCGDPDSIEVNVACAGNFARKPFDGANELDRIADAARAALAQHQPQQGEGA